MENTLPRGSGLAPLPPKLGGERPDFDHSKVFGTVAPGDLPLEYKVGEPLVIKDQGGKDFCAGKEDVAHPDTPITGARPSQATKAPSWRRDTPDSVMPNPPHLPAR